MDTIRHRRRGTSSSWPMGGAGQCPEHTQLCAKRLDEPISSRCDIQLGVTEGATIGAWQACIDAWHWCIGGKQLPHFPRRAHHRGHHRAHHRAHHREDISHRAHHREDISHQPGIGALVASSGHTFQGGLITVVTIVLTVRPLEGGRVAIRRHPWQPPLVIRRHPWPSGDILGCCHWSSSTS